MAISINIGGSRQAWEMDVSTPPVERVQKGRMFLGLFVIVFALFWGGLPVLGLVESLEEGRMGPETAMFLIFPAIGIGIFLFGVHNLMWRRRVAFDGQAFTVSERGLRGGAEWREPLSAYRGVMSRTQRVSTKNSSYLLYIIDLVHEDFDRKINLYTNTSKQGFREKWESYARALNLPAMEEGEGGMVRREAADLDKSVGELIGEGKVIIDRDAISRPARGVAVTHEGDVTVITRTGPVNRWWGALIGVLFPLIFVGVAIYSPDMPAFVRLLVGGLGALFEVIFVIGVLTDLLSRQRLRIGPAGVWVNRAYAGSETKGKRIEAANIETVKLGGKSDRSVTAVMIASDTETLKFGGGLPRASLEFVMNTILAKIAESERYRRRG